MRRYIIYNILLFLLSGIFISAAAQSDTRNNREASTSGELDDGLKKDEAGQKQIQTFNIPETVYQKQGTGWYTDQSEAWRQVVQADKSNAEAWFNYYKAARYSSADKSFLDQIVAGMNANIPNTFETHYVNYIHSDRDLAKGTELMQAYLLGPERKEIYKELAVYFTLKGDADNLANTLKKWSTTDDIPQPLMNYSYNLLNTVPQQSILITDGEYDTYPMWILQSVKGHRTDVKILNISLLKNETYKERVCREFGLTCYGTALSRTAFVQNLVNNNPGKVFYFSYTVNQGLLEPIEPYLLNEGLAYRYETSSNYNYGDRLKDNWELVYKTDYLQQPITGNEQFSSGKMKSLHLNYVSSGLELYDIYQVKGEKTRSADLYELLLKLAKAAGKEEMIKSYIRK